MKIQDCNPFLRAAELQPAVLEGQGARMAYDHRLFYILEGEGMLLLQERSEKLLPDTLLFFCPGVGYHFRGKMRVAVLNFDLTRSACARSTPICPPPVAEFDPALFFDETVLDDAPKALISPERSVFREDVLTLVRLFRKNDASADAVTSALLKKLLAELLCETSEADAATALIRRVRRYLRMFAPDIRSSEQIGQEFGYHPVYLAALYKKQTGETLHHALQAERIRLAKEWLARTDHSVEQIAYDTGFSSRSHFCTVFKEFTGGTPHAFRGKMSVSKMSRSEKINEKDQGDSL